MRRSMYLVRVYSAIIYSVMVGSLLWATPASADIGPKPTTWGATPLPAGKDMPGIEVEMVEEQVDLLLRAEGEHEFRLDVRAEFRMKNHRAEATFETGFPIGAFLNFEGFSANIDGKLVKAEVVDRGGGRRHDYCAVPRTRSRPAARGTRPLRAGAPRSRPMWRGHANCSRPAASSQEA